MAYALLMQPDGTGLILHDPWLGPYADSLRHRYSRYAKLLEAIEKAEGSLLDFANGHSRLGFTKGQHNGLPGTWYREWAPGAESLALIGDFNGWNDAAHRMVRDQFGVFELFVPDGPTVGRITHGTHVKVRITSNTSRGKLVEDRIPAYIQRVEFNSDGTNARGVVWMPEPYAWKHKAPPVPRSPRIYEAHVGMSSEQPHVSTFKDFARDVLPRIERLGYNTIQLMAIQEHPYYGSFGYHVSNFFAVSSRFGTPDDFRALVDEAHGRGIRIVMDLVHSHSVKNTVEGLNGFDGTDHQYFHAGPKGQHPAWDSLLFDYGKWEVLRFLLSNIRYWLEAYNVDGFRFDGVTSMMYLHHGIGQGFSSYDDFLRHGIDEDAVTYLTLANKVAHDVRPECTNIAEDVSGMVGLCRPIDEGGIGFDYRLAMGLPDYWIKILKEKTDEQWGMDEIFGTLCNRRHMEAHISYVESHDQALVGDKTIAFWLMDKEMYWHMNKGSVSQIIDRGIALHKMIRLVTFSLGGEGYLNFMGNEFGHPEWIDFPREGNSWSYQYCRRQWSLSEHPDLRYQGLNEFDIAMQKLDEDFGVLASHQAEKIYVHEADKILAFRRGGLTFIFNFHPTRSQESLTISLHGERNTSKRVVLNTDSPAFGGFGNANPSAPYPVSPGQPSVTLYLPARTAQVLV